MRDQSSSTQNAARRVPVERRNGPQGRGRHRSTRIAAFAEELAHAGRTPLTVIQEYADLMREGLVGALNDEQQRVLDVIADRACDLNRIVDNAVDASKLATKTHRVWGRRCTLRGIVARIRQQLLRKAAVRKVDLKFEVAANVPDVHCDDEAVGRALANIVAAVLNLSCAGCRMSISQERDPTLKEAGIRVTVEGSGLDAIRTLFRTLTRTKRSERENRASQLCEASVAMELIDCNLGRLAMTTLDGGAITLWIGLPIADPIEILYRHLVRVAQRHPGPQRVSMFRAGVRQPIDEQLSRDVGSILNLRMGRSDLVVELDRTRWLVMVVRRHVRNEAFRRCIERRREAVNRRRLGRPLPQISVQTVGSWHLPNDLARILATVGQRIARHTPPGMPADAYGMIRVSEAGTR